MGREGIDWVMAPYEVSWRPPCDRCDARLLSSETKAFCGVRRALRCGGPGGHHLTGRLERADDQPPRDGERNAHQCGSPPSNRLFKRTECGRLPGTGQGRRRSHKSRRRDFLRPLATIHLSSESAGFEKKETPKEIRKEKKNRTPASSCWVSSGDGFQMKDSNNSTMIEMKERERFHTSRSDDDFRGERGPSIFMEARTALLLSLPKFLFLPMP